MFSRGADRKGLLSLRTVRNPEWRRWQLPKAKPVIFTAINSHVLVWQWCFDNEGHRDVSGCVWAAGWLPEWEFIYGFFESHDFSHHMMADREIYLQPVLHTWKCSHG